MGLTQTDLGALVSLEKETIGRIERGKQMPSLKTLGDIATALGADPGDLVRNRPSDDALDIVLDRIGALLRRRGLKDAQLILDLAERIFRED